MSNEARPKASGLDAEAERVDTLAREILRENYLRFALVRLELVETTDEVVVKAQLRRDGTLATADSDPTTLREIEGRGVGLVDAFMKGVIAVFAVEYPSLKTIAISDFRMGSGFDGANGHRSDASAVATLRMRNSEGVEFEFFGRSPSVTRSAIHAALEALTFFLNSERAYIQLTLAMQDAKARRRSDLVDRYRVQMGVLVHATSYSEVIEKLRGDAE